MSRCLYCYKVLGDNHPDFHPACSIKIFSKPSAPLLPYSEADMEAMALEVIKSHVTVTGVQPKLSLDIVPGHTVKEPRRFTIVGLWGGYILKPPTPHYPLLPEVEDLTMHLASIAKIKVVPHTLIRLPAGQLAYITKRIDRVNHTQLHMEDMCQLTERLTEDKYEGSYEKIAKTIKKYSANPGLDLVNFFEQVLFSFLTGNADMHLKNFSLIKQPGTGYVLAPAYDMLCTALVNPGDKEEMALTLNSKKNKITRADFIAAFSTGIDARQQENIFTKMEKAKPKWMDMIDAGFLTDTFKQEYKYLIQSRFDRLNKLKE